MVVGVSACNDSAATNPGTAAEPGAEPARKRIVAAIRGMPTSMVQQRTQPPGLAGSVPGLDALQELLHAGLTHYDSSESLVAQLAEGVPTVENGLWSLFPDGRMETT